MRKWLCSAAAVCVLTASLAAEDWPGWRGPDRTDVSKETGLLQKWPSGGPKLLWTFDQAGIGYSGFSVVDGKLYTMAAYDKDEYVICLDSKIAKMDAKASSASAPPRAKRSGAPRSASSTPTDGATARGPRRPSTARRFTPSAARATSSVLPPQPENRSGPKR